MKNFKLLAISVLAATAMQVSAQEMGGKMDPNQMAQKRTAEIKAHVTGITSDEESKILAIEQDFAKSAQSARASSNGDRSAMHTQMEQLKTDRDTKIKAVLTADQYAQYTQYEQSNQGQWKGKRGGN
jgi:hypothetical protein